jgi:hypothetical protein
MLTYLNAKQMPLEEFVRRIQKIKAVGYVESHRHGDTGVGKTLEDLLGIAENNISGPDMIDYELKAARRRSKSLLTLFTKAPLPSGKADRRLLDAYGYLKRERKLRSNVALTQSRLAPMSVHHIPSAGKELHVNVTSLGPNKQRLQLRVSPDRIDILNPKHIEAFYDGRDLKRSLEKKYPGLIYVLAEKKRLGSMEQFWYDEAYQLKGLSYNRFIELLINGTIILNLRIGHHPDGRLHDHGTGFRISPVNLPLCFREAQRIL